MRIAFSCIVDNRPLFAYQAYLWVTTLIHLAQRKPQELVVHLTEACDPEWDKIFAQDGVTTIRVPAFDPRHPHSNKLSQLNSERLRECELVVLSDCDVAFCQDIAEILTAADAVRAKPVDNANLSPEQWRQIYAQAGFLPPEMTAIATIDRQPAPPLYFNGGLYVLPQHVFAPLRELWPRWNRWTLDHSALLEPFPLFTDQVSFALSLQELGCPAHPLSMIYNCPTHLPFPAGFQIEALPRILHYHHCLDKSGLLLPTSLEPVNRSIEVVNALIRERGEDPFDIANFWSGPPEPPVPVPAPPSPPPAPLWRRALRRARRTLGRLVRRP